MKKKVLSLVLALAMVATMFAGCGAKDDTASVYYLNFKPEQDEAWQELAKAYTEATGVEVTVVTAASGNYETTLMAEMAKKMLQHYSRLTDRLVLQTGLITAMT